MHLVEQRSLEASLEEQFTRRRGPRRDDAGLDGGWRRRGRGIVADSGSHRRVSGGGLVRVGDADDLAELDREVDELSGAGKTLLLIGVEQVVGAGGSQHTVEFPGEVGSVADPGTHPLAGEGWGLMGGVTGQQDST